MTLLESPDFPFEGLSAVAGAESWRKEVNRPIYHVHKWWAKRLGSVFRGLLLGADSSPGTDLLRAFYEKREPADRVVFDPFMGSGTTVGEAFKLGLRAVGRDINPVSHFLVRNALAEHSREEVVREFEAIAADTAPAVLRHHRAEYGGGEVDVLYHFWVMTAPCPGCGESADLFSRFIFSKHAYPKRRPEARAVCPDCGAVGEVRYDDRHVRCAGCGVRFDPQAGPASGRSAGCRACGETFPIARAVRASGRAPQYRPYAKMVLLPDGRKVYLRTTDDDRARFGSAAGELAGRPDLYPVVPIRPGHNTDQVLGYGFTHWHTLFNPRQLLCLGTLAERVRRVEAPRTRELLACLLSGCLEFNNMLASFKGEGTGAVRHAFSNHILKPERTPLEANPWGTPKSSGSFSTLFRSRILRALDYQDRPFEVRPAPRGRGGVKVFGASRPVRTRISRDAAEFLKGGRVYLSCGDSADTDLPDGSVDFVVTDPPFFDNVHYSQLADFFHVWQRHTLGEAGTRAAATTRREGEVRQVDAAAFEDRLGAVWGECRQVLREDGLLTFIYHHSRPQGWRSVLSSLNGAGFRVTAAFPVKSELSVAAPKQRAREPIDYDIVFVCRPGPGTPPPPREEFRALLKSASEHARRQLDRLRDAGRGVGRGDVRVILLAQVVLRLSRRRSDGAEMARRQDAFEREADLLFDGLRPSPAGPAPPNAGQRSFSLTTSPGRPAAR